MRILGIDYGEKRIGFALSDSTKLIASAYEVYHSCGIKKDIDHVAKLVAEFEVDTIVIGLPLNMDATEGKRAKQTRYFGDLTKKILQLPLIYQDERLTSVEAIEYMNEARVKQEDRRKIIDKIAAQIILQSYLDEINKKPVNI